MSDAPGVDDMSGGASVDRLHIRCAEQQPEEQNESAVEDEVFRGGDHRNGAREAGRLTSPRWKGQAAFCVGPALRTTSSLNPVRASCSRVREPSGKSTRRTSAVVLTSLP